MLADLVYLWKEFRLYIFFLILIILVSLSLWECQYQAVKKYYPGISRLEYMLLEDKLRIMPDG